jgi:molybdopterin-containing oxidoreductase family iron-sulfur binding subunit
MSDGIKRREVLKVLGVSGAGAGLVGCSTENVEKLLPYVVPPEDVTPGVATWYSSVCQECPAQCGIWVRTREGRAVKVEGNPDHPVSGGATCARGQGSLQGLYNPDRFTGPMARENGELRPLTWDEAEQRLADALAGTDGDILFLGGPTGPSMGSLIDDFVSAVGGRRIRYDALSLAPLREASRLAFGSDVVPRYDFSAARFVVSFGADFLETWLSPVEHTRGFSRASSVEGEGKAPFVFVGPRLSLTGQNADEWIPIRPGGEAAVALGMAHVITGGEGSAAGPYAGVIREYDPATAAQAAGVEESDIRELAERFVEHGPGLAVGPGVADHHRNATASNLAVLILNQVAGNVGRTVHLRGGAPSAASAPYADLEAGIRAMAAGEVGVALVRGANPAYTLPPASGFQEAFAEVGLKVSFASEPDETTAMADLILPDRHFLESWGDSNPAPGLFALQQPVMQAVPHFEAKQTGDVLLSVGARMERDLGFPTFYDYLRDRWGAIRASGARPPGMEAGSGSPDDPDGWWREALRRGVVEAPLPDGAVGDPVLRSPDVALTFDVPELDGEASDFALLVYPSSRLGDGAWANRPWLLELPDPVSKITWSSWLEIHPDSAARLGVETGDVVSVTSPHGAVELPVWTYPGIREDTVAIAMGLGHENGGRWADGKGVNPMHLLPAVAEQPSGGLVTLATRCSVEPTGGSWKFATVEGSDDQHGRGIAQAVALTALEAEEGSGDGDHSGDEGEHGEEAGGHGELKELQLGGGFVPVPTEGQAEEFPLPGAQYGDYADWETTPRWAMAIDLDKCTGCSACVTACQAENNVPYVGEEQVAMGREMHWVRMERYYETVDASHAGPVDVRHLPMICQHCGNAPCEPVCPVFAAYHTPDGLNGQIYNRCVGTRYCANNCPYKVRVFNWYTLTGDDELQYPEPMNWQFNPDVTVRENGVMEKCSFCVQRIREAQNRSVLEERDVHDGEVVPACQQSCPAEAIVFGNIRDPESRVAQVVHESPRTYRVLDAIINTQPAVTYQKKVTLHEVSDGGH